ncbi:hypothetical protein [Haladaptatus halobius]|uniref:hypothetical protein n=1 Tax=Haladaptatus halobius TaxID=2884875 RepID=UPI001D0A0948|nr:hypothetical protein [Haladaptatus halobius]
MKPVFRPSEDELGVTIIDPIQRRQYPLRTSTNVRPDPSGDDRFYFPVDNAAEIVTDRLNLPFVVISYVRDLNGEILVEAEDYAYEQLPKCEYIIELCAPIKIYIRVNSELVIASSAERMEFDFGSETRIQIGARSYHRRPGATITTTASPRDIMAAISTFGSALKTTSCERSLPSFRGHPPRIQLDEELHIPDEISPPETGVRIEVPPITEKIYPVSTLAYYLGATVVPGNESRLATDDGFTHILDHPSRGFEGEVERVLKQLFFLDCITRTEGYYQVELHERNTIEDKTDLRFEKLYHKSLSEQLPTYLNIPFNVIQKQMPTWSLVTHVTDKEENIESLPYLVNNFSIIQSSDKKSDLQKTSTTPQSIERFLRGVKTKQRGTVNSDYRSYVAPSQTEALEQAWLGSGKPIGANKVLKSGFENRFNRPSSTDAINITVVCNDDEMSSEYDDGDDLYGERDELEFDIDVHRNTSVEELKTILTSKTDFLHYIGHIKDNEFICRDGGLDARTLNNTAVDTFLLNGCRSYKQGKQLIELGSIGGIVTYNAVGNVSATSVGQVVARLLNRGFSLRSALTIARNYRIVGNDYLTVGDGSIEITQSESGTPMICEINRDDSKDGFRVNCITYPTLALGMGAFYTPYIEHIDTNYLIGGNLPTFTLSSEVLTRFLRLEPFPVIINGDLFWSTEIDLSEI